MCSLPTFCKMCIYTCLFYGCHTKSTLFGCNVGTKSQVPSVSGALPSAIS